MQSNVNTAAILSLKIFPIELIFWKCNCKKLIITSFNLCKQLFLNISVGIIIIYCSLIRNYLVYDKSAEGCGQAA